ncbi:response regulator transcription factor [Rhodanobacter sp. Col0626]|uniref:response regulator transcription factor n=1 Tax=Rhodanobacter sp. Col0626 TaxID=3415679 RepID=UPI003CE9C1C1
MTATALQPAFDRFSPLRVLLLEDDELLRDHVLTPRLRQFGFEVTAIGRAAELHEHLRQRRPDIVLLDVGLPDRDGFDVARQLRSEADDIGIVMLTGRAEGVDHVRGLSEGADAYLSKPVDLDVLVSTLHSLARRLHAPRPGTTGSWRLDADGWCLISPFGSMVALTKTERRLLEVLIERPNQIVSREALIASLTADVYDFDTHRLDSLIHRLRGKVLRVLDTQLPLNAVHGEGYVLIVV